MTDQATQAMPAGYSHTEVGLIPSDWEVKTLGELGECLIGLTYTPSDVKEYGMLVLRSSNISDCRLAFEDNVYVDCVVPERIKVKNGDILICVRNGSRALIGKCALIDKRVEGETFGAFMSVFRTIHSNYVFYQFQSDIIQHQIHEHIGATINQITNRNMNSFLIPCPKDYQEETSIASVLSDVASLIASLEKLIAKKRDIKHGAMQELLILHKRRLPGFSGEWRRKKLGDIISDISDGGTPSTVNRNNFGGGISWVVIDDIKDEIWQTRETLSEVGLRSCSARLWQPETIILSTGATIGEVGIAKVPVATKQGICGIVVNDNAVNIFLKYWFSLNKSYLISKAQGTSIKEVRPPILVKLDIKLPKIEEQVAIAQVLSDMDAEIAQLKQKLDKYKMLKQGMMQVLLTGKIRLI